MSTKRLSENARKLLHGLIYSSDDTGWWKGVEDVSARNTAITELINFGLIELHPDGKNCRVTAKGRRSNALAQMAGLTARMRCN